jgi:hypothetical protein
MRHGMVAAMLVLPAWAAQDAPDASAPRLRVFAWLPAGCERDEPLLRTLIGLGVTGVTMGDGQDPALARRVGLSIYRDQLVGKGTLELREQEFVPLHAAYERERATAHLVRPNCLSDPATQGALLARALASLEPWLAQPPAFVVLGDEVSTTRHVNPLDFSFSPAALAEFRQFLRTRHRDVAALNREWQTTFATFDDVVPFTADQIRARELGAGVALPANLTPWAEHRTFMDRVLARTMRGLLACARSKLSVPYGLTGLQQPSAYGGTDYGLLLPELDVYEIYDIGGARDLGMSLAPPDARQITTLFPPGENQPGELLGARIADALDLVTGEDSTRPSRFGQQLAQALAQARPLARVAGAKLERSPLWIVESHPAVQAHWMLDSAADGPRWVRRLSSYEETHSTSLAARASWVQLCEDLGLQPRFVAVADLEARLVQQAPKVLVLAACIALSDAAASAITAYAHAGGVVLADGMLGFYDASLRRRERPVLDGLFGLEPRAVPKLSQLLVHEGRPAAHARLATGAAASERDVSARLAERAGPQLNVQCEHRAGAGLAVYLNLAVCEYAAVRLDAARVTTARDLRRRVQRVFDLAGVTPPVQVRGAGLPTCLERMLLRDQLGARFLAVRVHALSRLEVLRTVASNAAPTATLQFPQTVRLRIVGDDAWQGPQETFALPLDPWRGLFVELER